MKEMQLISGVLLISYILVMVVIAIRVFRLYKKDVTEDPGERPMCENILRKSRRD